MKSNGFITTRKRLLIAIISITFLFCLLAVRLFFVQVTGGEQLRARAAEQWYRDLPLKAKRGTVYDVNGKVIVDSKNVFTVYVRPRAVTDRAAVVKHLGETLGVDENSLADKIAKCAVSEITVKKAFRSKSAKTSRAETQRSLFLGGLRPFVSVRRVPRAGCRYTNADGEGQNGLEGYYDGYLRGTDGKSLTGTDNKGIELESNVTGYLPSIPGADLQTSLDIEIQGFAEKAAAGAMEEWQAKAVNVLVMNVKTGGIAAMAHVPSYSLDDIPRSDVEMLNAYSKNTMIVDVYEPGSTFKIFTTAAAIEEGVVNDSSSFFCSGAKIVDGQRIKCWRSRGHGSQRLRDGVKNSCNGVFMDLALRMGTEKFYNRLRSFGFGSKTGVDFYAESAGLLMNEKSVKTVDLARIGFGQAVAVTPIQLASAVCATVGDGIYRTPHFVERITDYSGEVAYEFAGESRRVLSAATSEKMRGLLEAVVAEGSGKKAGVDGYRIGGKTGTAQKYEGGKIAAGKYVSSFVGFAPVQDPRYVVLMTIDEPTAGAYYGSVVAAPYVGRIFRRYSKAKESSRPKNRKKQTSAICRFWTERA
ncbi:MAG: peptidoglycan D,D-transpeptidase FtsI family protein [Christensenellales bacterium]